MILRLKNLTVKRSNRTILDKISAVITGSCAVVGPSGSGKSTLAKAILGLVSHTGEIHHGGMHFALIPQDPATALHPLKRISTLMNEVCPKNTQESLLKSMGFTDPERILKSYPHQLSGGMKQRILIALAVAVKPDMLIADEPTTGLDSKVQAQVVELLETIDIPLLLITHDTKIASRLCPQQLVLDNGKVEYFGDSHATI